MGVSESWGLTPQIANFHRDNDDHQDFPLDFPQHIGLVSPVIAKCLPHSHSWEVHRACDHNGLGCQVLWRMAQLVPHVPLRRRTWLDQSKMSSVPWDLVTAISCGCLNRKEFEIYILRFILVTCMLWFLDLLLSTFDRIVSQGLKSKVLHGLAG